MIISVSRRTDIPAFYTPWFMNRIRAGFVLTRNPYNAKQVRRVSLLAQDVDAFVFWTRNPRILMQHLSELDQLGYRYYFQYTLTGYPKQLEQSLPSCEQSIKTFCDLSEQIGAERVIWRYDPILLCNLLDIEAHKRLFSKIAASLAGKTHRVVVSFADFYKKTKNNLAQVDDLVCQDILALPAQLNELLSFMAEQASRYQMRIETCSEELALSHLGIMKGKCIDANLMQTLFAISPSVTKDSNQRTACGCIKSIDIGAYNTCLHGCRYCYATFNKKSVLNNRAKHDVNSPLLIGGIDDIDPHLLLPPIIQGSLF